MICAPNWEHLYNATLHLLGFGKLSSHGQEILSSPHQDLKPREGLFLRSPTLPTEPQNLEENSMGKLESLISYIYKCQMLSDATSRPP